MSESPAALGALEPTDPVGLARSRAGLDRNIANVQSRFKGQLGVAAKNLATGEQVLVNADQLFPTASVIKVSILADLFAQAEEGRLQLDEPLPIQASYIVGG